MNYMDYPGKYYRLKHIKDPMFVLNYVKLLDNGMGIFGSSDGHNWASLNSLNYYPSMYEEISEPKLPAAFEDLFL
jgi:hypothetical protein